MANFGTLPNRDYLSATNLSFTYVLLFFRPTSFKEHAYNVVMERVVEDGRSRDSAAGTSKERRLGSACDKCRALKIKCVRLEEGKLCNK